jgi:ATP-dependent helicase/nuclease subunit B
MRRLERLFPSLRPASGERPSCLNAPGSALDAAGPVLRAEQNGEIMPGEWRKALSALASDPVWRDKLQSVKSALNPEKPRPPLPAPLTAELYKHAPYSVTRLELFAACPYRHFVQYGLSPIVPPEPRLAANRSGSFLHRALEVLLKECVTEPGFPELPRERVEAMLARFMPPMLDAFENGLIRRNAKLEAEGARIAATARRAGWTAIKHLTVSAFRPIAFEYKFGMGKPGVLMIELADGDSIPLEGKIDRIDEWFDGESRYLRVIDYKSGSRARKGNPFDPTRFLEGLDLQLPLYLAAALPDADWAKPAGAFLFKLDNPVLTIGADESGTTDAETRDWLDKLERKRFEGLRLRGVMLDDPRVAQAMDNAEPPLSVPKMYNKTDGHRDRNSDLVSSDEMAGMILYAKRKAAALADRIRRGELAYDPVRINDWNACQWCDYAAVCQRDKKIAMRRIKVVKRAEMLANIAPRNP